MSSMEQSINYRGIIGIPHKHDWIGFEELWNNIIGKIWRIMTSSLLGRHANRDIQAPGVS